MLLTSPIPNVPIYWEQVKRSSMMCYDTHWSAILEREPVQYSMSELHDISNGGSKPQSAALVKKTADSGVVDMLEQEKRHGLTISSEPALPAVSPRPVSGPLTLRPDRKRT